MPSRVKALRCPFCGGNAQYAKINGEEFRVWCRKCLCATPGYRYLYQAIEAWNTRKYQYRGHQPLFSRAFTDLKPNSIVAVIGSKEQLQKAGLSMKGYGKKWYAYRVDLATEEDEKA